MKQEKINANSILIWVMLLAIVSVYLIFGKPWIDNQHVFECILSSIMFLFCLCMLIYRFVNRIYLTSEGVECCHFGKLHRRLNWSEVADVCLIKNYRFSAGGSNDSCIVIIPFGCERYNNQWSGLQYKRQFRGQVFGVEDSFRNRKFIEKYYGKIEDLRNK